MTEESGIQSIVRQMEQIFKELDRRCKAGEITFDDFQRELDKLKVEDEGGNGRWVLMACGTNGRMMTGCPEVRRLTSRSGAPRTLLP
jgi:hypothetical protein